MCEREYNCNESKSKYDILNVRLSWSKRYIIVIGYLTVWKAVSYRFHPESEGSQKLIFEFKKKQRRWCSFHNILN